VARRSASAGFSLVEVVVSIAIVGVIATSVFGGIISSITQTRRAYDRAQAAAWVQSELDFLRIQGYGIATTAAPRHVPDPSDPMNDPSTGYLPDYGALREPRIPEGFYRATIEVTPETGLPLKRLTLRLQQTPGSQPYTILVTYVSQFDYP
jgi:prepilin-type N-terminal cleavage/methylation domain-containing protein